MFPLGSSSRFPWSPGWIPSSGVVTGVICGQVMPPSNDFATKIDSVPASKTPDCLYVRYSSLAPCVAIHWRSTRGRSEENGLTNQRLPPSVDVLCVQEPSQSEFT